MKKKVFWTAFVGSVTSIGLFLIILGLLSFVPASFSLTAAYLWIAPALLLQGRAPSEAAYDAGVGPPDLTTWIICFLFWAVAGGLLYLWIRRMVVVRRSKFSH